VDGQELPGFAATTARRMVVGAALRVVDRSAWRPTRRDTTRLRGGVVAPRSGRPGRALPRSHERHPTNATSSQSWRAEQGHVRRGRCSSRTSQVPTYERRDWFSPFICISLPLVITTADRASRRRMRSSSSKISCAPERYACLAQLLPPEQRSRRFDEARECAARSAVPPAGGRFPVLNEASGSPADPAKSL